MSTLHVERLECLSSDEWIIRFRGPRDDFTSFIEELKAYGWRSAHWDPDAFGGQGGWMVSESVLWAYRKWFDNLEQCMESAQASR